MKKRPLTCLAVLTLCMASSMSVLAAPEIMPDGGVFDAEYYAKNNPDVVAVLGTDKDALYSHFVNNGKAEGRLGTAPVELTKAKLVTSTAKRKQLAQERYMQDYGVFYDKAGHWFDSYGIEKYFNDATLEQFSGFGDLLEFAKSIDVYKYADEVSFANSYYYQELKAQATACAMANVNNECCLFHYQTKEYSFSSGEAQACMEYMINLLKPYYGEKCTAKGWNGPHRKTNYSGTNINQAADNMDGFCLGIAIYRTQEAEDMYFDDWKAQVH